MDNTCPECGEKCDRVAVDIGVGTQFGPAWCPFCGWSEADPTDAALLNDIFDKMAEVVAPLPGIPDAPGQHAGTRAIEPSDGDEA